MTIFDKLREGVLCNSVEETEMLGAQIAKEVDDDSAIAISGDLGAGKTALVRGIAKGLDIETPVKSPTYNIYTIYQGSMQLMHIDAYRLTPDLSLESLMLEDFLQSPFLIAVEWPSHLGEFLENFQLISIDVSISGEEQRMFKLLEEQSY